MQAPTDSTSRPLFAGTVYHSLDDNHRVTVPCRWRHDGLSELFAVPDPRRPFLILLPSDELQKVADGIETADDIAPSERRQFVRQLFSRACPCPIDRQGRLVLPNEICSELGLRGEVVLAGGGGRIEVWQPERWRDNRSAEDSAFTNIAERIGL